MQPRKQIRSRCAPSATQRPAAANPILRFSPEAWAKLSLRRELGDNRVHGFGISAAADPLVIEDVRFLHRNDCTEALDVMHVLEFFAAVPWSVLFLVANGGATYARLRYHVGPGGAWKIPVVVDEPRSATTDDRAPRDREEDEPVGIELDLLIVDALLRPEEWPVTM